MKNVIFMGALIAVVAAAMALRLPGPKPEAAVSPPSGNTILTQRGLENCFDKTMTTGVGAELEHRDTIIAFAELQCGPDYVRQLVAAGASEKAAMAYVDLVANRRLDLLQQKASR